MIHKIKIDEYKPLGIVRKIDELGRIVIPKEYLKQMKIPNGTLMEIMLTDKGIFVKPVGKENL